jgi:hypothetical protein
MASIAMPLTTWTVDAPGNVTATFITDVGGTYEHWLVDVTSGLSSNHVVHIVSLSQCPKRKPRRESAVAV